MRIFGLPLFVATTLFPVALSQEYNGTGNGITSPSNSTLDNPIVPIHGACTDVIAGAEPISKRDFKEKARQTLRKVGQVFRRPVRPRTPPPMPPPPLLPTPDAVIDLKREKGLYVATISLGAQRHDINVVVDTDATATSIIIPGEYYGSREIVGNTVTDTLAFNLHGHQSGQGPYFEATHRFWSATSLPVQGVQGILAMSPGRNSFLQSTYKTQTFNYFALTHSRFDPQLRFGGCKSIEFGKMEWHKVLDTSRWIIGNGHISVKNGEEVLCRGFTALIDSGIPFIYGPKQDVEKIYARLGVSLKGNSDKYRIYCNQEYNVGFGWGTEKTWEINMASTGITVFQDCLGLIQPHPKGDPDPNKPQWLLGTGFLDHVQTVFRYAAAEATSSSDKYIGFIELER